MLWRGGEAVGTCPALSPPLPYPPLPSTHAHIPHIHTSTLSVGLSVVTIVLLTLMISAIIIVVVVVIILVAVDDVVTMRYLNIRRIFGHRRYPQSADGMEIAESLQSVRRGANTRIP